jgi:3'(2'), 5'-bisphosphate nucleotidase
MTKDYNVIKEYKKLLKIIYDSGKIAKYYFSNDVNVQIKKDKTELTQADLEIHDFLKKNIKETYFNYEVISEENNNEENIQIIEKDSFFIIDPIDGTKSFINRSIDFSINLSLIKNEAILFSSIYLPMEDKMYIADERFSYLIRSYNDYTNNIYNKICSKKKIFKSNIDVLCTKRNEEFLEIKKFLKQSSKKISYHNIASSKKFCLISEGFYDVYIRKVNIKIWDIVSGFHIARNSGLVIEDLHGVNIYKKIISKKYLNEISKNGFKIDKFIIKRCNLKLFN